MKILIYDLQSTGHHSEYVQHLLSNCPTDVDVFFAISKKIEQHLRISDSLNNLELPFLESESNREKEINWIKEKVKELEIDTVFFLNIDPYLSYLNKINNGQIKINGIWFHPTHRIPWFSRIDIGQQVKNIGKKIRAQVQIGRLRYMGNRLNIFILDDKEGVEYLNQQYNISFQYLPDPINLAKVELEEEGHRKAKKKSILLFGSIIPRKNLEALINVIGKEKLLDWTFNIIGKGKEQYVSKLRQLSIDIPNINIENEFVPNDKMEKLFAECDIVMMVYKNFFGSSGVLGRAAKYGKKVVVSQGGLIGHLVEKYSLGIAIKSNYKNLAISLKRMEELNKETRYNDYLADKTPENFTNTIYNSLND